MPAAPAPTEPVADPAVKTEDVEVTFKTIHSAVRWNKSALEVDALIKTKEMANMRDTGNGNFLLHIAAQNGHFDLVKLLLEKKEADINCQNNKLNTPLHMSLSYDYITVVAKKAFFDSFSAPIFYIFLFVSGFRQTVIKRRKLQKKFFLRSTKSTKRMKK